MKKIAITLLASAYAAHLFAQAADPSPTDQGKTAPEPAQESMRGCFWEGLQLTDDEKAKLKQIDDADRDGLRSAWAQVGIARESLHAALLANPENIADIQTKATNLANALSTSSVQMALHQGRSLFQGESGRTLKLDLLPGSFKCFREAGGGPGSIREDEFTKAPEAVEVNLRGSQGANAIALKCSNCTGIKHPSYD